MKLTIVAKKIGDKWEGALVAENKFQRAIVSEKLEEIVLRYQAGVLTMNYPEGTDVLIEITTEVPKDGSKPTT